MRTLLLFTAVVAVWLSFESRRAQNQETLVARIGEMGGQCQRVPREWIPHVMHRLLSESQGYFIETLSVEAMQAPTVTSFRSSPLSRGPRDTLFGPADIEELLRMPGMAEVRKLQLTGTSVTDDVVDELAALGDLQSVTFAQSAVTEEAIQGFEMSRPDCTVTYSATSNGPAQLMSFHREALSVTEDLTLFARAQRGDPEAITGLLRATDDNEDDYDIEKVQARIRASLERFRRSSPERADLSANELHMLLKEEANRGDVSALKMLDLFRYRTPFRPSSLLVMFLSVIDRKAMRVPCADTVRSGKSQARHLAVRLLGQNGEVDLLEEALADPVSTIRIEAVWGLSASGGNSAAWGITKACRDPDPKVREVAVRELPAVAGREALSVYLRALGDRNAEVRWQAVRALERYPDTQAVEPLIAALDDRNSMVRCAAARLLGVIADPHAIVPLETATEDEDSFVREVAKVALEKVAAK